MTGIYKITCKSTELAYIGQSTSIQRRFATHKRELKRNIHSNSYLQNAYNKYGEDNFTYEILEQCSNKKLDEREIFYIKIFNTYEKGYNLTSGGKALRGKDNPMHGKEGRESPRFIDSIYQIDKEGNIIGTFNSANMAAKSVNGQSSHILDCLKTWKRHIPSTTNNPSRERMTHKNSQWIYEKDYKIFKDYGYDFSKKRNKKSIVLNEILDEGALDSDI